MPYRLLMTSALGYALLGLLARGDRTGYDLTRLMHRPVGYFWAAGHSQVYPELARLEAAGLVRHREIDGAGPRPTKLYAVTPLGRRELTSWVTSDPELPGVKDPLMVRVYSLWLADPAAARDFVATLRSRYADRLAEFRAEESTFDRRLIADPSTPQFAAYAALRAGMASAEAQLHWCDWLTAQLGGD